jgi:hypothetical protein
MCLSDSWRHQPSCRLAAITRTSRVNALLCAGNPHSGAGARARYCVRGDGAASVMR